MEAIGDMTREAQRRAGIIRLVTSPRVAHDNYPSGVLWPIPHQDEIDQQCRALTTNRAHNLSLIHI